MKNRLLPALFFLLILSFPCFAQVQRCITEEKMQEVFQRDPQAKVRYETTRRLLDEKIRLYLGDGHTQLLRTQALISIPVAVHIMTPNPLQVTDAIVQAQIDTLNFYYGNGPAGDSLRVYQPFRTAYGRSRIRFCLAQRTPGNLTTSGIERMTTFTTYSGSTHPSTQVPAWNTEKYLNIWVVNMGTSGILGYSYKPGTFPIGDQRIGFVVDYRAFGSGGTYEFPAFNQGRTAVHEIGHYFNLDHPWGQNNSGNPTCALDDGCGDTPPTSGPSYGCPSALLIPVLNSCSSVAPGVMWQNHMDYADDACMNLFTLQQVAKMEAAVENAPDRNTLLSSNGCQPVVATPNDAGITTILAPVHGSISCATSLIPLVTLRNFGTSPLTSVTINVVLNGTPQPAQSWTGSLLPGTTTNIYLAGINLNAGNNTLSIATSLPNGAADGDPMNDGASSATVVAISANLPVSQGFEDPAFPPAGWFRLNPNNDFTWQRVTPGKTGAYSLFINNYDVDGTNNIDDFRSVPLSTTGVSTLFINFDVAHKFYGSTGVYWDTLSVLVSNDCGVTYQTVYKKWGPALATAGSTSAAYTAPTAAEWRQESIPVSGAILSGSDITVVFRNTSRFGNNIFIDNINIQKQSQRDLKLVSINTPAATACSRQITPSLTVLNTGAETITSFRAGYSLDNGTVLNQLFSQTLNPGDSATISLPLSLTSSGNRMITAFTADPVSVNGIGDIQRNNDTVSKAFTVVDLQHPTVKEGFELSFPSSGWSVLNPNGDFTWVRTKPGNNSLHSVFIDNFTHIAPNQTDDIKTPYLNVTGADSLIMSFDLAHKNYPDPANSDTLTILVSADCGNTYTEVYKKSGAALATAGPSSTNYTTPVPADWRKERISVSNALLMNGSVNVLVRNTNRFGNNIFIDNMNIDPLYHRDARVVMISDPASVLCNGSIKPAVTIRNAGMENITGLKISYRIDNGPMQTHSPTGLNLPRDASVSISLPPANVSGTGAHSISIFSWEPVSVSGSGDQFTANDTLTKTFSLAGTINAPMAETFNDISFAPANWSVVNPDAGITWNQFSTGNGNAGSAYINTFNYPEMGQKDDLASPNINFSGVDSVTLSFDLAAANYSSSGTGGSALDTLEVLVSKDCGNSFTTVYKKWGADLQTITDPNYNPSNEFFPAGLQSWRKETIDLTGLGGQGPLMLFFRTTSNWENNLFIDNVNLTTRVLPDRIKKDGYLILPSPFRNNFGVWHVETPVDLKYIRVYNAMGQLVVTKTYSGNALKMEMVDMNGKAAGVYVVQLGYSDESRNVSERVVKY